MSPSRCMQNGAEDAGLWLGAAAAGQRLLGRLPSHRRGPGGDRRRGRRAGARACSPSMRAGARVGQAGRTWARPISSTPVEATMRISRRCTARGTRIRANAFELAIIPPEVAAARDVQLQEVPRLLLLLSADRPRQARRGAAGEALRPDLQAGQGQVHGRALGPQVFHAAQGGPDFRRRVPLLRHREALAAPSTRRGHRCAAASPAAAAATTTSCPSSAAPRKTPSSSPPPTTSDGGSGRRAGTSRLYLAHLTRLYLAEGSKQRRYQGQQISKSVRSRSQQDHAERTTTEPLLKRHALVDGDEHVEPPSHRVEKQTVLETCPSQDR